MTNTYYVSCKVKKDCTIITDSEKTVRLKQGQKVKVPLNNIAKYFEDVKIIFKKDGNECSSVVSRDFLILPNDSK